MVGPGALKPKVGDGIKSRRPFSAPVLILLFFFFCFVFVVAPLLVCTPSGSVGAIFRYIYIYIYIVRTSSSQCACVTSARFYLGESQSQYIRYDIPSSSSSAKGKRQRASCPRICASSSVVRPREREATETAEEREAS